jgi:DNA processing protein
MSACERCLRRSALLQALAPWIERSSSEGRRLPALLALPDDELVAAVCGRKRPTIDERLARFDPDRVRDEAARTELWTVCRHEPRFPPRLLEAPDAPALLYGRGEASLELLTSERPVAVVGSRRASPYGLEVAHGLARELSACGVPVVSGMALGVDSAAHEGALEAGGLTVAVLGGGADVPYPRSKRGLHRRIAAAGLVVSEFPPRTKPFRWSFPARNRIMAALSEMTVVVEGNTSSGSLITAGFAADLGRDVGAVPGQVTSRLAEGPNDLIRDGACVVRGASDVLEALYGAGQAERRASASAPSLDERLQSLLDAVERGRGSVDAIASDPGDVGDVLAGLTELELIGLIRRGPSGSYVRCA